ncbi:hypothetical protein EB796_006895 [Bugula neritina]|uniref:Reverse transcriptase domain-containing protein n=1 Tax=Bugula neritina TaxID=10212 RepID=A0A7J7K966_BUGNE|nr:hypothetical protein EB796_006895 [Bugula neritina]
MFLVCINDISDIFQSSSIKLFADDALLYRPVNTLEDSVKFQEDLASLEQWASQWKMSFNTEKCLFYDLTTFFCPASGSKGS